MEHPHSAFRLVYLIAYAYGCWLIFQEYNHQSFEVFTNQFVGPVDKKSIYVLMQGFGVLVTLFCAVFYLVLEFFESSVPPFSGLQPHNAVFGWAEFFVRLLVVALVAGKIFEWGNLINAIRVIFAVVVVLFIWHAIVKWLWSGGELNQNGIRQNYNVLLVCLGLAALLSIPLYISANFFIRHTDYLVLIIAGLILSSVVLGISIGMTLLILYKAWGNPFRRLCDYVLAQRPTARK